ncbi:cupin domain-containing protein [Methylocystis heyeri]|uniref:DUF861 domain-containing protein n=1 Tax=Methylocystis heyeri TaxID=391905 RepID=A0A6B8KJ71_9HYPH|nr:cupin domain-containing protein [Methylocystis heyeri]QGM47101.1 DUF861 domain-containing protein [Methylocystis heyeri]
MSEEKKIEFGSANGLALQPAPINPEWIREGAPVARNGLLSRSADGSAFTLIWDCTGGVFEWRYDIDETVFILEGSVTVSDGDRTVVLGQGDTVFFPAGTTALWRVESYVRKVAFCRRPPHRAYVVALETAKNILRALGLRKGDSSASAMFGEVA